MHYLFIFIFSMAFHGNNNFEKGCTVHSYGSLNILHPDGITRPHKELIIDQCRCRQYRRCD